MLASDVDRRIISPQIVRNWKLWICFHQNTEKPKNGVYRLTEIDKMSENSTDQSESQKIYMSMERMYSNAEILIRYFGDSLQLTNWVLESSATCHMTPDILNLIPN